MARGTWKFLAAVLVLGFGLVPSGLLSAEPPAAAKAAATGDAVVGRTLSDAMVAAFNRGDAAAVAGLFLDGGELTDDAGNLHKGREAIQQLLGRFFQAYPGAKLQQEVDSGRMIGPWMAIQQGTQTIVTADGKEKAAHRFTAILVHLEGAGWSYATCLQSPEEREPSPRERLEALAWLVGDWTDESKEAVVSFSCRWSEDGNFLLVNYDSKSRGRSGVKSSQRIGWDPLTQRVRSWVFDSDGGYGEGHWTPADASWIIKSTAVMPDGQTGSATLVLEPQGRDKFVMKGLDRIVGEGTQPDFQVTIVRKAPAPGL